MTEQEFLEKYDAGEKFDGFERKLMAYGEFGEEISVYEGYTSRWAQDVETVFKVGDRFFSVLWQRGLTEQQENYFDSQPEEVRMEIHTETLQIVKWVPIGGRDND